ncbi:putative F-box/FBD/LRR-repeat protein-like [Capsicum annuum]|nr:putative F-box/FBD/LRR-repeat protein-like [Capsicum annuum]
MVHPSLAKNRGLSPYSAHDSQFRDCAGDAPRLRPQITFCTFQCASASAGLELRLQTPFRKDALDCAGDAPRLRPQITFRTFQCASASAGLELRCVCNRISPYGAKQCAFSRKVASLRDVRCGLLDVLSSARAHIGIKRMGEIDSNAFQNALKQRFSNQEAEIKAIEFLSLWQEKIKEPDWHPFKTIMIDESNVDVRSSFGYFSLSLFLPEYFLLFLLRIIFGIKSFEVKDSGLLFLLVSCPSVLIRSLFASRATWKNFIVCGWTSPPLTRGRGFDFAYGKNSAGKRTLYTRQYTLFTSTRCPSSFQSFIRAYEFSVEAEHDLAKIFESIPALENFCWEHEHVQGMVGPAEVIPTRLPSALNCLKRLYISCISLGDFFDLSFALCLIRSSSNLEDIEILVVNDVFDDIGGDYYESVPQDIVDEIPTSFSDMTFNRLRTVKIYNVTGKMAEMQLMKVLLAKSPALIRMVIQPYEMMKDKRSFNVLAEITKFQRASSKAEVVFNVD